MFSADCLDKEFNASSFVILPFFPDGLILLISILFSATIFLTAGESSLETEAGSFIVSTSLTSSTLGFSIIGSSSIVSTVG